MFIFWEQKHVIFTEMVKTWNVYQPSVMGTPMHGYPHYMVISYMSRIQIKLQWTIGAPEIPVEEMSCHKLNICIYIYMQVL